MVERIKIYIDQGHNPQGFNAGAEGNGLREQDITFAVGRKLFDLLSADPRFEARLSRPTAETVLGMSNSTSLQQRVNDANGWGADYFISIHANAAVSDTANGTEVYVYSSSGKAYDLAADVLSEIVKNVGTRDNGVRINPSLYVLRKTRMPAILTELAYITNPSDAQKLKDDQQGFARGIYEGLLKYLDL